MQGAQRAALPRAVPKATSWVQWHPGGVRTSYLPARCRCPGIFRYAAGKQRFDGLAGTTISGFGAEFLINRPSHGLYWSPAALRGSNFWTWKQLLSEKKPKKGPIIDPHAKREAERYEKPITSREVILAVLEDSGQLFLLTELAAHLGITGEDGIDALRRRVRAMQRDGQIHIDRRGRLGLSERLELVRCRVIGHRDGYGFASPLTGGDDFFLSARDMQLVFDGDTVLISQSGIDHRGRPEGKVIEVLERGTEVLPGRYMEESGIGYLMPYNTRITQHILIPPNRKAGATPGQMVSVKITDYPTKVLGAKGAVQEILGDHLDPGLEIDIAIRAHQIPWEWPESVLREAGSLRDEPSETDKLGRFDLRDKPFVTIDGEDARDFDDAVYCERNGSGFRLWVAIADVCHYVRPGSALDEEAENRGNSVYFPERVVPMFPEVLSNGLCSLKPRVDRLAMVCEMEIDKGGMVTTSHFYEAVIHSHARLTYTQVGEVIEEGWHQDVATERYDDITRLHELYVCLRAARARRGAIDFETVETRIVFNESRKIEAIVPVHRNDAHKLIEECMLAANVATAEFLETTGLSALFRVHEGPSVERLSNLRAFLGELSLDLPGGDQPTPEDYQTVLAQLADRDDATIIQTMMLRSLSQAVYQPENKGHFGLHYGAYAHFTSPIRRYPDLLVHRAIRHMIRSDMPSPQVRRMADVKPIPRERIYPYQGADMAALGEHCSVTERRADDATREVEAWLKCEFLRDKLGETFDGLITAVTGFGLFVELRDLYIEGLVHISALPGDYYHLEQAKQRLVGERTRQVFQLGGSVRVVVARVDLDERKIDLELDAPGGATRGKPAGGSTDTPRSNKTRRKGAAKAAHKGAAEAGVEKKRGRAESPKGPDKNSAAGKKSSGKKSATSKAARPSSKKASGGKKAGVPKKSSKTGKRR